MNDDGTPYAFNPFAQYQQLPPLTQQTVAFARDAQQRHRTARDTHYQALSPGLEAEYALIYALELLWNAVKTILSTYGRLGIGVRVAEDDLEYEDDLVWMGAKTEIGVAGEGVRRCVGSTTRGTIGSSSAAGSSSSTNVAGGEPGEAILHRLRSGQASDGELCSRMKTIVRLYDTLMRGKKEGTSWITEKAVLRSGVYSVVLQGFSGYPLWHEDKEFVDQFYGIVDGFVNYDR